jgi:acetate kinase
MILVLNLWSSSLKYELFSQQLKKIRNWYMENIKNHEIALKSLFSSLSNQEIKAITIIGHRVVHWGELFTKPTKITPQTLKKLKTLHELAPLHNPVNIKGIEICQKLFPKVKNIAVFDTAFHASMEQEHFLYALPKKYYKKYGIRRYGFHGNSHQYLRETYSSQFAAKSKKNTTIITCHLWNWASIALIKNGKVIETSMGLTPLEGLIMGTRCWSIDPAIIPFVMKKERLSVNKMEEILNKESWLLALSEKTNDMKTLIEKYNTDSKAKLAVDMFIQSIMKYIGAYTAIWGKVDAIIFSWWIGERGKLIRQKIIKGLKHLGDAKFLVIPTNEEYIIAKEAQKA